MKRWGLLLVGLTALLLATLIYQDRGWYTPKAAGFVPAPVEPADVAMSPGSPAPRTNSSDLRRHTPPTGGQLPVTLSIANIHVTRAPIVQVTSTAGRLDVPDDPRTIGWWSGGAKPGSSTGTVVLVGHVDSARLGRGAFFHLATLAMGSSVSVTPVTGSPLTYRVVGRRVYAKQSLPTEVFATRGPPRLVLITCGGPFNTATRHYRDNVVVYAVPTS
jgi:hypothetical protein